jgi:hypothetical protein
MRGYTAVLQHTQNTLNISVLCVGFLLTHPIECNSHPIYKKESPEGLSFH